MQILESTWNFSVLSYFRPQTGVYTDFPRRSSLLHIKLVASCRKLPTLLPLFSTDRKVRVHSPFFSCKHFSYPEKITSASTDKPHTDREGLWPCSELTLRRRRWRPRCQQPACERKKDMGRLDCEQLCPSCLRRSSPGLCSSS